MQYLETMKAILPLVLLFLSTTLLAQNIPSIEQVEAELVELKKKDDLRTYALNVIKHYQVLLQLMQENIDNSQEDITELNHELRRAHAKFTSSLDSATWVNSQLNSELQDLNDSIRHLQQWITSLEENHANEMKENGQVRIQIEGGGKNKVYYLLKGYMEEPECIGNVNDIIFCVLIVAAKIFPMCNLSCCHQNCLGIAVSGNFHFFSFQLCFDHCPRKRHRS